VESGTRTQFQLQVDSDLGREHACASGEHHLISPLLKQAPSNEHNRSMLTIGCASASAHYQASGAAPVIRVCPALIVWL